MTKVPETEWRQGREKRDGGLDPVERQHTHADRGNVDSGKTNDCVSSGLGMGADGDEYGDDPVDDGSDEKSSVGFVPPLWAMELDRGGGMRRLTPSAPTEMMDLMRTRREPNLAALGNVERD